jgi:hypothetical protein
MEPVRRLAEPVRSSCGMAADLNSSEAAMPRQQFLRSKKSEHKMRASVRFAIIAILNLTAKSLIADRSG